MADCDDAPNEVAMAVLTLKVRVGGDGGCEAKHGDIIIRERF